MGPSVTSFARNDCVYGEITSASACYLSGCLALTHSHCQSVTYRLMAYIR